MLAATVTVAVAWTEPPAPVQVNVYEVVVVGDTLVLPLVGCVPDQPALAVQAEVLVLDQESVEPAPD